VLGRATHELIPPIGLAFWRWTFAALLVLPFVMRAVIDAWPLLQRHLLRMVVLALLGVTGFNTFVYLGLQTTTATNSVLIQSTMPILILVLNAVFFRTRVAGREWVSVLVSLVGVVIIVSQGQITTLWGSQRSVGDLWILLAALTWATYSVCLRWRPQELDAKAFLGFTLVVGWMALLPLYLSEYQHAAPITWSWPIWLTVGYVAIFPSALAFLFWNRGVEAIGANAAGHFAHLMPVFGTLMAVVFLGEQFRGFHALGAVLVALGISLTWRARSVPFRQDGPTR
jgi:drug/metabolite transporter (DMT)-like permease